MLTLEDRKKIDELYNSGCSLNEIGRTIDRTVPLICREIQRNSVDGKYNAEKAHELATNRRYKTTQAARDAYSALVREAAVEGRPYRHFMRRPFSYEDRKQIESLFPAHDYKHIAKALQRDPSVIAREIKRHIHDGRYDAKAAQYAAYNRRGRWAESHDQPLLPEMATPAPVTEEPVPKETKLSEPSIFDRPEDFDKPGATGLMIEAIEKDLKKAKGITQLEERVFCLEEQIKILTDIIKERQ